MSDKFPSYAELQNLTDREILMLVVEELRSVSINQCNHLKHHEEIEKEDRKYSKSLKLLTISIICTGVCSLIIGLIILVIKVIM